MERVIQGFAPVRRTWFLPVSRSMDCWKNIFSGASFEKGNDKTLYRTVPARTTTSAKKSDRWNLCINGTAGTMLRKLSIDAAKYTGSECQSQLGDERKVHAPVNGLLPSAKVWLIACTRRAAICVTRSTGNGTASKNWMNHSPITLSSLSSSSFVTSLL